jgi:hypothetical protein
MRILLAAFILIFGLGAAIWPASATNSGGTNTGGSGVRSCSGNNC